MAWGAPETGNGATLVPTTVVPWSGDGILISSIDFGEITRETLPYAGLTDYLEKHFPGDLQTARAISFTGFLDVGDPEDEWPNIEDEGVGLHGVSSLTLTMPDGSVTYKDDGYLTSVQGPNFANNELLVMTCTLQTNHIGASRGWSTVA